MALIPIVDQDDNVLYQKERAEISLDEIYRVSACWVTNSHWDILLAQRAYTKKHHPGKWWPAVAGTVTGVESYLDNILHEIEEEIWIEIWEDQLQEWPYYLSNGKYKHFTKRYIACIDLPIEDFTKEEGQVEELRRRSPDELNNQIEKNPNHFLDAVQWWKELFKTYL